MKPYQRLNSLLKQYRREIGYVYMYGLLLGLMSLSLPIGIQAIVNFIMMGQLSTSWVMLVIILTIALILYSTFLILQVYVTESIQQKMLVSTSFEFIYRLARIKNNNLNDSSNTELVHRFFELTTIQKGLSKILLDFSLNSLLIIVGLIILSFYHVFFLVFSLIVIAILYVIFRKYVPVGLKTSLNESTKKYELAHWYKEVNNVSDIFKINSASDLHISRTNEILTDYLKHRNDHFKVLRIHYLSLAVLKVVIISGLLIAGSIMVISNQLNLGQFIASEILVFIVVNSVEKLIYTLDTVYDTLTSIEKLGKVMDLQLEPEPIKEKIDLKEDELTTIKFVGATILLYGKQFHKNINFHLVSGDRVAVCGNSGSGKTLLIKAIATLHPVEGNVYYNDIDVNQLNMQSIRRKIGLVFSEPKIFDGSFIENIALSNTTFDINRIYNVCETVKLNEYIKNLPDGYETRIRLGLNRIPKDIQLKIELARVLYKNPKVVLFDSDLHYLTTDDREHVITQFNQIMNNSIIVYNTASPITVNLCNKVLYMDKEKVSYFDNLTDALNNRDVRYFLNQ